MNKQRKFILIAAAIGVIATFLPWWSFSSFGFGYSVNGFHGLGILAFLCFVAAGIMAYMDDQTVTLGKTKWMATLIAGAVAALIIFYYIVETSSVFSSLSIGIYLAALAAAGIVISAFLFKAASDNLRDGFGSLRGDLENRMKSNQTNTTTTTTTNTTRPPSDTPDNLNPPM